MHVENEELDINEDDFVEEEEINEEEPVSSIEDMLANAIDGDFTAANSGFEDIMHDRIGDAMDQERAAIANDVFNGVSPESIIDQDVIDDDESGEMVDLDDDDIDFLNSLEDDESPE